MGQLKTIHDICRGIASHLWDTI
jgi:hypothetical protein